jgi:hypothetical protein
MAVMQCDWRNLPVWLIVESADGCCVYCMNCLVLDSRIVCNKCRRIILVMSKKRKALLFRI